MDLDPHRQDPLNDKMDLQKTLETTEISTMNTPSWWQFLSVPKSQWIQDYQMLQEQREKYSKGVQNVEKSLKHTMYSINSARPIMSEEEFLNLPMEPEQLKPKEQPNLHPMEVAPVYNPADNINQEYQYEQFMQEDEPQYDPQFDGIPDFLEDPEILHQFRMNPDRFDTFEPLHVEQENTAPGPAPAMQEQDHGIYDPYDMRENMAPGPAPPMQAQDHGIYDPYRNVFVDHQVHQILAEPVAEVEPIQEQDFVEMNPIPTPSKKAKKEPKPQPTYAFTGQPAADFGPIVEANGDINTKALMQKLSEQLRLRQIPQSLYAKAVLNRSQGTLSDMINDPKPWDRVKSGRDTFVKILNWLQMPEEDKVAMLKVDIPKPAPKKRPAFGDEPPAKRFRFNDMERNMLRHVAERFPKPTKLMVESMARRMGLEYKQVNNFFLNLNRRQQKKEPIVKSEATAQLVQMVEQVAMQELQERQGAQD